MVYFYAVKKAARTRQYIIEKTSPVFNRQGFSGTSLSDLEHATGLSKGSIYGNFTDKKEIALAAFAYAMQKTREFVSGRLATAVTAREKLDHLLRFFGDYVFNSPIPGGCPLLNNAVEADDFHLTLREAVVDEINRTIYSIAKLIEEGKRNGEFYSDTKSRELATIFFTSIEGAIMVSRVSRSDKTMKTVIAHCKSLLDKITIK